MRVIAGRQAGYSLIEVLVATAIGCLTMVALASVIKPVHTALKANARRVDEENLRVMLRGRVDCSMKCREVKKAVPAALGDWQLSVACDGWYDGFKVMGALGDEAPKPVFEVSGGDLCHVRSGDCMTSCHNRGVLMERGFLFPPVEHVEGAFSVGTIDADGVACPSGTDAVGVDFALRRLVCQERTAATDSGRCREVFSFTAASVSDAPIEIGGRSSCTDYTSIHAMTARLGGQPQIKLAPGFVPGSHDRFTILTVINGPIVGRFAFAGDRVAVGYGEFRIEYEPNAVVLTGYTVPPVAH